MILGTSDIYCFEIPIIGIATQLDMFLRSPGREIHDKYWNAPQFYILRDNLLRYSDLLRDIFTYGAVILLIAR